MGYSLFHQLLAPLTSCLVRGTTAGSGYASTSAAVHRCLLVHTNTGGALVILFTHNGGALVTLFTFIHLRTAGIVDTGVRCVPFDRRRSDKDRVCYLLSFQLSPSSHRATHNTVIVCI